jgi:2-keto-3-deoxy-L-rhamnonate aldolase RhmA
LRQFIVVALNPVSSHKVHIAAQHNRGNERTKTVCDQQNQRIEAAGVARGTGIFMPKFLLYQPSTDMAMMAAYAAAGWRDVVIDLEHGPHSEADVLRAATALSHAGAVMHLKLPNLDPERCARYAEFGIRHFMLPHVESASDVRTITTRLSQLPMLDPATIGLYPLIESRAAAEQILDISAEDMVAALQVGLVDFAIDCGFGFSGFAAFADMGEQLLPHLLPILDAIRSAGKPNGCMLLPAWMAFFPLERVDQVTVPVSDLLSLTRLRTA